MGDPEAGGFLLGSLQCSCSGMVLSLMVPLKVLRVPFIYPLEGAGMVVQTNNWVGLKAGIGTHSQQGWKSSFRFPWTTIQQPSRTETTTKAHPGIFGFRLNPQKGCLKIGISHPRLPPPPPPAPGGGQRPTAAAQGRDQAPPSGRDGPGPAVFASPSKGSLGSHSLGRTLNFSGRPFQR